MAKNLEVKIALNDLGEIAQSIKAMGLREVGNLYQTDKYYLMGEKRLKLRNMNNELQLIYYSRPNAEGSRISRYHIFRFKIQNQKIIETILRFFFTLKTVVIKKRTLYTYKHTRIHLDEVKNLGKFLEIETVFSEDISTDNFYKEHSAVVDALGLSKYRKIRSSYSDLIHSMEIKV